MLNVHIPIDHVLRGLQFVRCRHRTCTQNGVLSLPFKSSLLRLFLTQFSTGVTEITSMLESSQQACFTSSANAGTIVNFADKIFAFILIL